MADSDAETLVADVAMAICKARRGTEIGWQEHVAEAEAAIRVMSPVILRAGEIIARARRNG